jgi:hypothetical protein
MAAHWAERLARLVPDGAIRETTTGRPGADSVAVEFVEPLVADAEVVCDLVEHDVLDLAV